PYISAFLSDREEWSPQRLKANEGLAFQGSNLNGIGFVLELDEAQRMLDADPKNAEVIFPYLSGQDLNTDPEQKPSRFVINFWDWEEERAREYILPYERVLNLVKPHRDSISDKKKRIKERWWIYESVAYDLYHAIGRGSHFEHHPKWWNPDLQPLRMVIASARVGKYFAPSLIVNTPVFHEKVVVFANDDHATVALLNSCILESWVVNQSSSLGISLNFSPTDAAQTLPLPTCDLGPLRDLGETYLASRRRCMVQSGVGLTSLNNAFHNPTIQDEHVSELRALQCQIDTAAVDAYSWDGLDLGHGFHEVPYLPENDRVRFTISEPARIEVLRRLAELNRQRYEEEVAQGLHGKSSNKGGTRTVAKQTKAASTQQTGFDFVTSSAPSVRAADGEPAKSILDYLRAHPGWHAKSDVLGATGLADGQWNTTIGDLVAQGHVERKGEKRGTRYRVTSERHESQ